MESMSGEAAWCLWSQQVGGEAGRSGDRLRCVKPDLKTKAKAKLKKETQEIHRQLWMQGILNGAQIFVKLVQESHSKNFFQFLLFEDRISDSQRQWITRQTKRQEKQHSLEGQPWIVV